MSTQLTRSLLFAILVSALAAALATTAHGYFSRKLFFAEEFQSITLLTLTQFSGPISIIAGSYFAHKHLRLRLSVPMSQAGLALALTVLWCVLSAGRTVAFILVPGETVPDLVAWNGQVVTGASYLTNAVLAYFFVSASGAPQAAK